MCALLAKRVLWQVYALPPILRVQPLFDAAVKGRMRPVAHAWNQAVFNRVEVKVIHVMGEICFFTNLMLPETALPQSRFVLVFLGIRRDGERLNLPPAGFGNLAFDDAPALAEVRVALRQRPDGMHVVGQHDPGVNRERQGVPRVLDGASQGSKYVGLA